MRTEKTVDELCRKWQKIRRLEDWEIHTELFSAREFEECDRQGEVVYDMYLDTTWAKIVYSKKGTYVYPIYPEGM